MKNKILMIAACIMPLAAGAENVADTTVTYGGNRIVIGERGGELDFKVFDSRDYYMTKTAESVFIDGREEERTFVGQPVQYVKAPDATPFDAGYPTVWYGFADPTSSNHQLWAHRTGTFELGVTPFARAFLLKRSGGLYGVATGVQLVYSRVSFDKDCLLRMDGSAVERIDNPATTVNNMYYGALRVPLTFRIQTPNDFFGCGLGFSFEARTNAKYNFSAASDAAQAAMAGSPAVFSGSPAATISGSPATGSSIAAPDCLRLKRFGINFEGYIQFGVLTVGASVGLTPLFKSTAGDSYKSSSLTVGVDLIRGYRMLKKHR